MEYLIVPRNTERENCKKNKKLDFIKNQKLNKKVFIVQGRKLLLQKV